MRDNDRTRSLSCVFTCLPPLERDPLSNSLSIIVPHLGIWLYTRAAEESILQSSGYFSTTLSNNPSTSFPCRILLRQRQAF